jgi:hypothetical protein
MKKFLVMILFSSVAAGVWAQDSMKDLTTLYNEKKLTILSSTEDPASLSWNVTEGFKPINEPTFLRLAGYEKEAQDSANNLMWNTVVWSSWGVLLVGGGVVSMLPMILPMFTILTNPTATITNFWESPWLYVGLGMMAVSVFMPFFAHPEKITTVGQAASIARAYNEQLLEQLKADLDADKKK